MQPDNTYQRDALTGVYARGALELRLREETDRARRYHQSFSLVVLDLDHFKSINDAFGHKRGDEVLVEFTQRLLTLCRSTDLIFRYGGDEFVLILPHTDTTQSLIFAQRLLDGIRASTFPGEPPLTISASIGVSTFPTDGDTPESLFAVADQRHYQAKRAGRGRVVGEDLPETSITSLEAPSRLIERDRALETLQRFLKALPDHQRGIFHIIGAYGLGISRFLQEVRKAAELQNYGVLMLRGQTARKYRVYGVLSEARHDWPGLPLPATGQDSFATALQHLLTEHGYNGLLIILDDLPDIDRASLDCISKLFLSSALSRLALVYATSSPGAHRNLPQDAPLREQVLLEPLSPTGTRTWLRHTLHCEVSPPFLTWFHQATSGQPARIARGLAFLVNQGIVTPGIGRCGHREDFATLPLADQLDRQTIASPHNLPGALTDFVGREADIERLKRLIEEQRLIILLGPGGIGKTRLATQAAAESISLFPDGVYLVALSALSSADFLLPAIAEALRLPLAGADDPRAHLLSYMHTKDMLLVLDNFEQLRDSEPLLLDILERAPGVRLLITSRDRLRLPGGETFELSGLPFPTDEAAEHIEHYAAVQLFLHNAHHTNPDFVLTDQDRPFVARICRLLEGMPLGLELAAAWVRMFSCQSIATWIDENLVFLMANQPEVPARHFSLSAIIESFWNLLGPRERSVLRQMAIFRGGFRLEAARQVVGASPFFLDALVAKAFLHWTHQGRYAMHELLRQYAADQLHSAPHEQIQVQEQHALYYAAFVHQREAELLTTSAALADLQSEIENIRTAWNWAVSHANIHCLDQLAAGLAHFYTHSGRAHEGATTFAAAIDRIHRSTQGPRHPLDTTHALLASLYTQYARLLNDLGDTQQATVAVEQAARFTHATLLPEHDPGYNT